jgi:hypothetical protein
MKERPRKCEEAAHSRIRLRVCLNRCRGRRGATAPTEARSFYHASRQTAEDSPGRSASGNDLGL